MFQESFTRGFSIYDGFLRLKRPFGRLYYLSVWQNYFNKYIKEKYNTKLINFPKVGNPSGVILNDQVIPFETIRHCYFANQFKELLKGEENPLVVEIGGGFGGFAQQFLSKFNDKKIRYVLYDLPEVNVISAYFLMKSFPSKKFLLFNNQDPWRIQLILILLFYPILKLQKSQKIQWTYFIMLAVFPKCHLITLNLILIKLRSPVKIILHMRIMILDFHIFKMANILEIY